MFKEKKNAICIIPARSGSKRIKNKNIIDFCGKPLISYSIQIAIKSRLFERIIVSTDSVEISKIAIKYGAEVPFLRSKKLADDYTGTNDVMRDAINKIGSNNIKYHCCIYPTAPLIEVEDLINAFNKIKKKNYDCLIATNSYNSNPLRSFRVIKDKISFKWKVFAQKRSQDLENLIHDSGTFYIYNTKKLLKFKKMLKATSFYNIDKFRSVDINTFQDLKFAEFLCKYKKFKKKL